jgi:tRNA(Arg) A34 adenosine deaminase TadA
MHDAFMQRAMELARAGLDEAGALPYAAVVVKDGRIVGEGLNRSVGRCDPTSHGEVEAIRDACERLKTVSLAGCDLYTTAEPCSMCVATMYLAGIERLFYGADVADTAEIFARLAAIDPKWTRRIAAAELRREIAAPVDRRRMPAQQLMADESRKLLADFVERQASSSARDR